MREKKYILFFTVPPVLLAALLIWLLASQGDYPKAGENGDGRKAGLQSTRADGILRLDTKAGEDLPADKSAVGPQQGLDSAGEENGEIPEAAGETLLFAGDIYLSPEHVLSAYDRAGGITGVLDEQLRSAIGSADIFMANEEFPFSDRGTAAQDKQYTFRLPPARVEVMRQIGPDIVALANNHALDYGPDALLDTCRILDEAGIRRVGAGVDREEAKTPVFLEAGEKTIGFLAASRVIPESGWAAGKDHPGMFITYDPAMLIEEIQKTREQCDFLVVYVHWGVERNTKPEEYQRTLGKQYIDAGADLVVGSHPHVLQGIEYYKGKPIVYSLGNFVFGSSIPRTALLEVELPAAEGEEPVLRLLPCTSKGGYTRMLEAEKQEGFFREMEEISFDVTIDGDGTVRQRE